MKRNGWLRGLVVAAFVFATAIPVAASARGRHHRNDAPLPGGCNEWGCWQNGGGCNQWGCWNSPQGSCNQWGCSDYGGCNEWGCWNSASGSCNEWGCTNNGTCTEWGCP